MNTIARELWQRTGIPVSHTLIRTVVDEDAA